MSPSIRSASGLSGDTCSHGTTGTSASPGTPFGCDNRSRGVCSVGAEGLSGRAVPTPAPDAFSACV